MLKSQGWQNAQNAQISLIPRLARLDEAAELSSIL